MRFTNVSGVPAGWTFGFRRDGRELLVVIVKATYALPDHGGEAQLHAGQVPLVEADRFSGEPGASAPLHESDYAHGKPACDVLLLGSAHAPGGRPTTHCGVGLKVGSLVKQFKVVGPRHWQKRLVGATRSAPQYFSQLPISYDVAFGGTDRTDEADGRIHAYEENPVGRGYWHRLQHIDGQPLPSTEALDEDVDSPDGRYRPQAFSPIGRSWLPRRRHAGTYDQDWIENTAPLWPDDFDERYFQAAAPDQVMPWPQGGEEVVLKNLTPDGLRRFALPRRAMPVTFIPHRGHDVTREASIDTLVFEPDEGRFSLTWRVALPLGRSVFDVKEVIAGEMSTQWHRERRFPGKTYHASLADAVRAKARGGRP
ncbi:DUF2169 domain-containing protein [Rhizobacter sp. SG703]|uniref:DUF2169 family type VI secretion system accessory protein n=1 Tax=Rhizobacter sp. SG703 TaxID=2587140 RepID=UPI001444D07E|nr:DUF2169 domain-containing protein [Rhizobacter sp. SG703]NKI94699.1 hypothetical protein [Rhizobacter sp. SG703]